MPESTQNSFTKNASWPTSMDAMDYTYKDTHTPAHSQSSDF